MFAAILLLNHHLNSLPLGKKQLPPSREKVQHLLQAHSQGRAALSNAEFIAVCQDICAELATGVSRNMFVVFVACPFLASKSKSFLLALFGNIHPFVGALLRALSVYARSDLRAHGTHRSARREQGS